MPLTRLNYVDLMRHAAAKAPDSRFDLNEAFNRAGRRMTLDHEWVWRRVYTGQTLAANDLSRPNITCVSGQEWIDLPADFVKIESVGIVGSSPFSRVKIATEDEILGLRATGAGTGMVLFVGLNNWRQQAPAASGTLSIGPRAQIYPTPTSNAPVLQFCYLRSWLEVTNDTHLPAIPLTFERLLMLACRAEALNIENEELASTDEMYLRELDRMRRVDGGQQVQYGRWRGGAQERMSGRGDPGIVLGTVTL